MYSLLLLGGLTPLPAANRWRQRFAAPYKNVRLYFYARRGSDTPASTKPYLRGQRTIHEGAANRWRQWVAAGRGVRPPRSSKPYFVYKIYFCNLVAIKTFTVYDMVFSCCPAMPGLKFVPDVASSDPKLWTTHVICQSCHCHCHCPFNWFRITT